MIIEYGEHCYGKIMKVDGKDHTEMTNEEKLEIVNKIAKTDEYVLECILDLALGDAEGRTIKDEELEICDQCGNPNHYEKKELKD